MKMCPKQMNKMQRRLLATASSWIALILSGRAAAQSALPTVWFNNSDETNSRLLDQAGTQRDAIVYGNTDGIWSRFAHLEILQARKAKQGDRMPRVRSRPGA
jgi:hypothetical protein